jgi:predicted small secreted protein
MQIVHITYILIIDPDVVSREMALKYVKKAFMKQALSLRS